MTLGEVLTQDQYGRQLTDNGFFSIGEASPVEANNLLRAIERDIQARREAIASLAMWQRLGEQDLKDGHTLAAAKAIKNTARYSGLIAEIEAELAYLCIQAAQAFGNQALKAGA